jgi:rare lipoprotein A
MKRWLAALAVFAACACHVDIAAADTRPPTLWQRIVSVFAPPRPPIRHPAGQHFDNPQKATVAKPTEAPAAAGTPSQAANEPTQLAALPPAADPATPATPVETSWVSEPFPEAAQPEVAQSEAPPPLAAPAKSARKQEHRDKAKAHSHADTTAALSPSAPASDNQPATALAEPSEPPSTIAPDAAPAQFKPSKKAKHAKPGYELASLGSPGLKAALPLEDAPPDAAPHRFDGSVFPPASTHGSVCNTGRKVVTAYYWEGSHTASGEAFNPHAMTAAHRTLPFGTHLNVVNPRTGKSVEVIVNDRGPYTPGVGLDLSIGAAQAIGLHGTGSVCIL